MFLFLLMHFYRNNLVDLDTVFISNSTFIARPFISQFMDGMHLVFQKSLEVLQKIRESCNPTVICGSDDYEVLGITDNCISLPNTVDCLQGTTH